MPPPKRLRVQTSSALSPTAPLRPRAGAAGSGAGSPSSPSATSPTAGAAPPRPGVILLGRSATRSTASRSLRKAAILNHACKRGWPFPSPNLAHADAYHPAAAATRPPPAITLCPGKADEASSEDVRGEADMLMLARRRLQERVAAARRRSSPLGLSDYAALDEWRGFAEPSGQEGDEDDDAGTEVFGGERRSSSGGALDGGNEDEEGFEDEDEVYSDFNFLDPVSPAGAEDEDGEYDDPFAVLPQSYGPAERRPPDMKPPQPQAGMAMEGVSPNWHAAQLGSAPEVCG
jgi:hypothetical protein